MPLPSLYMDALHSCSIPARGIAHGRSAMAVQRDTATIYRSVIDEVVTRIKPDFVQEGVDECAFERLEWTVSMTQSSVDRGLRPPAAVTQVHPGRAPRSVGD